MNRQKAARSNCGTFETVCILIATGHRVSELELAHKQSDKYKPHARINTTLTEILWRPEARCKLESELLGRCVVNLLPQVSEWRSPAAEHRYNINGEFITDEPEHQPNS